MNASHADRPTTSLSPRPGWSSILLVADMVTPSTTLRVLADNTEGIQLLQDALVEVANRYDQDDHGAAEGMPS
ncbi:hypothetical protein ACFQ0O_11510 [Saccharopolyspora spinosporotrichia]